MFVWKWLRKYENDEKYYFNIVKRQKYCKPGKESEFNFQFTFQTLDLNNCAFKKKLIFF